MHPKWGWVVVSSEFLYAGASDRYVAIVHGFTTDQLTLIDEQTGTSQTPSIGPCGGATKVLLFGGPMAAGSVLNRTRYPVLLCPALRPLQP